MVKILICWIEKEVFQHLFPKRSAFKARLVKREFFHLGRYWRTHCHWIWWNRCGEFTASTNCWRKDARIKHQSSIKDIGNRRGEEMGKDEERHMRSQWSSTQCPTCMSQCQFRARRMSRRGRKRIVVERSGLESGVGGRVTLLSLIALSRPKYGV